MNDADGVRFLQWALPRLGLRWEGFRKPRRQVLRRIVARMAELGVSGFAHYQRVLERDAGEWRVLERLCRVTISRFYRDRGVWEALRRSVLPELIARAQNDGRARMRAWSAGCASGEEPTTLRLVWTLGLSASASNGVALDVVATDADPAMLERAVRGIWSEGSLRELPEAWVREAFERRPNGEYGLRRAFTGEIEYRCADVMAPPEGPPFDLVLCRNVVFIYHGEARQRAFLERLSRVVRPDAALVVGAHETVPQSAAPTELPGVVTWRPEPGAPCILRYGDSTPVQSATPRTR